MLVKAEQRSGAKSQETAGTVCWLKGVQGILGGTMVLTCEEKEEEGGIFNHPKEHEGEGSEEEDNEFLFVLSTEKAVWVWVRV